ncbi:probable G-protein coupled receptor 139 [Stegostoma tigrinum]|uniref:probable G-protein coupled receptor 139 n=1 Tax=Stegostoma tigrinum TaxID=3053191 RepID=UPI0028700261|nr:probable G-protein coupled receptor 139 [Stegostoma tigrinum]
MEKFETLYITVKIYYVILAVVGVPVNLVAIMILSRGKCGLSTCTTHYLMAMAVADLLVIIVDVILWRISFYYFPDSFLNITPVCSTIDVLSGASTDCSVWFTVVFSFDRFVAICCQKLRRKFCTGKVATGVLATTCILLCSKNTPFYFTFEPEEIINNIPWFCNVKPSFYRDPEWMVFDWIDMILTPWFPFGLILFLNALTVRHIIVTSRIRKRLKHQNKEEICSDPEMKSRRKSTILLFTISSSFILLWLAHVVEFLYYNIAGMEPTDYSYSLYTFAEVGFMLRSLNCCTNTFIYGVTQSKFRDQLRNAVNCPISTIIQSINNEK